MTAKQLALLRYICGYQEAHGYSPSFVEMRDAMGLRSKTSVWRFLRLLTKDGYVRRLPNRDRAIEVLRPVTVPHAPDGAPLYMVVGIG